VRDRAPDAATGAGYEGDLIFEDHRLKKRK
jgi:hypothetical protein